MRINCVYESHDKWMVSWIIAYTVCLILTTILVWFFSWCAVNTNRACERCSNPPWTLRGWRRWCSWRIRESFQVSWQETLLHRETSCQQITSGSESEGLRCVGEGTDRAAYQRLQVPEPLPRCHQMLWFSSSGCRADRLRQVKRCSTSQSLEESRD